MTEWKRFFLPPSQVQVEQSETQMGVPFPPLYRAYLLSTNGGQPCSDLVFDVPERNAQVMLGGLYGIAPASESLDLATEYEEFKERIPTGYIPIGTDPGGNQLLLATVEPHKEHVFFWDQRGFLTTAEGKNLFLVASDIEQFLRSLQTG